MKIAFVGKGGSGKSTMAALFTRYLAQRGQNVLVLDADVNTNMAGLLGVNCPAERYLSLEKNAAPFKRYLRGNNTLIRDENAFLPTTPPMTGSNLIVRADDPALSPYAVCVQENPVINLVTVGTYMADDIGHTCYHGNLFVAENLLSHTQTSDHMWVVADMVAGTDAFSYSLHVQFDAIILIVEPTPESVQVCRLYYGLAQAAGVEALVHLVVNKANDADDVAYITRELGVHPVGSVPMMSTLRKARQAGCALSADQISSEIISLFDQIAGHAENPVLGAADRFAMMRRLHENLCPRYWVISGYGDDVKYQYGDIPDAGRERIPA